MTAILRPRPCRLVVTGAAAGIGLATARLALARGWDVHGLDRAPAEFPVMQHTQCELADSRSVAAAFDVIDAHWPEGFDALVHCAGIYRVAAALDRGEEEWDLMMTVNARGTMLVAREAARRLTGRASAHRSITLLSSIAAQRGYTDEPAGAYAASKGAVEALTRQLAVELGHHGIRVNAVAPGVIDTTMPTITADPPAAEAHFKSLPLGRIGEPGEVAEVCLFLASEHASYITGAVLPVDGGEHAR